MKVISYGSWPSPFPIKEMVKRKSAFSFLQREGSKLYWIEKSQGGRSTLCSLDLQNEKQKEETPGFEVRSKVNEYGGFPFLVVQNLLFFTDSKGAIYIREEGLIRLLHQRRERRYASFCFDSKRRRLLAVCENTQEGSQCIVSLDLQGKEKILIEGSDFYSSLALDPKQNLIAFLSWNHPNMPWEQSELHLGFFSEKGEIEKTEAVVKKTGVSLFQPSFSEEGELYFISDETGWGNLYKYKQGIKKALLPMEAEFSQPAWVMGLSRYAFIPKEEGFDLFCVFTKKGKDQLAIFSEKENCLQEVGEEIFQAQYLQAEGRYGYFVGATSSLEQTLFAISWDNRQKRALFPYAKKEVFSVGEEIFSKSKEGEKIYGFFYPPLSLACRGPEAERPPLIVKCHGGPTAQAYNTYNPETTFWTCKGFAVLEVNYRGSSGYGKKYQEALLGNWGIFDVNDVCDLALLVAEKGLVDRQRMAVKGRSSGGYTALAAACFRKVFSACVSYYGIADLKALVETGHKFELYYTQKLVAPYPEKAEVYKERSPIYHSSHIECPVLLFHGTEDKIVFPEQSINLYQRLKKQKKPVEIYLFEGEGHSFRKEETWQQAFEREYEFYKACFAISP